MAIDITEKVQHYSLEPTYLPTQVDAPPPAIVGLPDKYTVFRPGQWEFIDAILKSDKRFIGLQLPTGTGKSVIYTGAALLSGQRSAMLTATKTLSDQLYGDMQTTGMVDIRGMNNYLCLALAGGEFASLGVGQQAYNMSCEDGPCMFGIPCSLKMSGCLYFDKLKLAKRERLVCSNYSYFMHQVANESGLGEFDWLFMDEAHDAIDELTKYMQVTLEPSEIEGVIGESWINTLDIEKWRSFAQLCQIKLGKRFVNLQEQMQQSPSRDLMRQLRTMRRLMKKLVRVAGAAGWIVFKQDGGKLAFAPVWPNRNAEGMLFNHIPHVVMVSATLTRKTMALLGVPEGEYDYFESGSRFPVENWPLFHVPTGIIKHSTEESVLKWWVNRMDQIIDGRLDRKGVIHTTSYWYRDFIMRYSRHSNIMLTHERGGAHAKVQIERFKAAAAPCVLISPAVGTGHDFAFDFCRYQIITKIPFPDMSDPLMAARCKEDKEYQAHVTAQKLVQMTGRGMRAETDWCENFVIDDSVGWFLHRNRRMFPQWWLEGYKKLAAVPPAMMKGQS